MPYADGNTPVLGDKVKDENGNIGTVTDVQLNATHLRGHDAVTVVWDSAPGGIGVSLAVEYCLVSRK